MEYSINELDHFLKTEYPAMAASGAAAARAINLIKHQKECLEEAREKNRELAQQLNTEQYVCNTIRLERDKLLGAPKDGVTLECCKETKIQIRVPVYGSATDSVGKARYEIMFTGDPMDPKGNARLVRDAKFELEREL